MPRYSCSDSSQVYLITSVVSALLKNYAFRHLLLQAQFMMTEVN
jgi:hypothetical protein